VNEAGRNPVKTEEVRVQLRRMPARAPTGLSFEIPDLLMLRAWTEFHDLRMSIDLDVCADGDEYEELLGIYDKDRAFRRWMLWRSCEGIVVKPAMDRSMLFDFMGDVLEILIPSDD
jgi:hypothetical protein